MGFIINISIKNVNIIKDRRIADNNVRINDARNVLKFVTCHYWTCLSSTRTQRSGMTQIDALNDLIDNWFHKFSSYSVLLYHALICRLQKITGHSWYGSEIHVRSVTVKLLEHNESESLRLIQRYCSARWEPDQDHSIYLTRKAFGPAG